MQKIFYFFITVLFPIALQAQSQYFDLQGKIFDATTQKPLALADIFLKEIQKGTVSDGQGNFIFKKIPNGEYTITISYVGYQSVTKKINTKNNKEIKIYLNVETENLQEVVVKSSKKEERELRNGAMTVSVLSSSHFQGTTSSLDDVLKKTVGITIRSQGGVGSGSRISVRGLEGKRIGIFLDNMPMNQTSDYVSLHDVPIDMIERIEIYKGIVPAKLGGSAMGGAVNLILKEYPPVFYDVSYELASFNTHKIQSLGKLNFKKSGIEIGASVNYTYSDNDYEMDLPHHRGIRVKRNHDRHRKLLYGVGLKATKWWFDEVGFEAFSILTDQQIQGIETNIQKAFSETQVNGVTNKLEKKDFLISGLDFDMNTVLVGVGLHLNDTSPLRYDWEGNTYPPVSSYGGEIGLHASDTKTKSTSFLNRLNLEYIINENQSVNFNSQFTTFSNHTSDPIKEKISGYKVNFDNRMFSWIAGLSYDLSSKNKKWLNSFTTKYYYYKTQGQTVKIVGIGGIKDIGFSKGNFGISDAIRYHFTENLLARTSLAYDVRLPIDSELLGDGFLIAPAANLKPERNTSVNLGFLYQKNLLSDNKLEVEINGFYSYITDMIRFSGGVLQSFYENFGKMRSLGIEAEVKADIFPSLYGYANVTYQDLRDKRDFEPYTQIPNATKNKRMPNIPYFLSNAGLEFHKENLFGGKDQNTRLMLDASFIEKYWYDFEVSKYQERRIPRSLVFHFGVEQSFKNGKILLSARVNNLTDQKVISEFNRPLPGRNFGVKIRYRM